MLRNALSHVKKNPQQKKILFLVAFGFVLRMVCLPFSQVVDADAVSRIFMSRQWLENPTVIYEGVWLPLHQYWNALLIFLSGSYISFPIVVNCLLASMLAWPVFRWVEREFDAKTAFWTALFLSLSPVIFRNSFQALSGTPFLLLVAFACNELSLLLKSATPKHAYRLGLFLTLAAGFRYEAWLLMALFGGFLLVKRQGWNILRFAGIAAIFPLFWLVGNGIAHGHILYGLPGVYNEAVVAELQAQIPRDVEILRLLFYPLAFLFVVTPFVLVLFVFTLLKRSRLVDFPWWWTFPFVIFFPLVVVQAMQGTLVLQYRFTGILLILFIPVIAWIFANSWSYRWKQWLVIGTVLLQSAFSYVWMKIPMEMVFPKESSTYFAVRNFRWQSAWEFTAIPRLKTQEYEKLKVKLPEMVGEQGGLVLDFVSWDVSYNLALHSGVRPDHCYILPPGDKVYVDFEKILTIIKRTKKGVILVRKGSAFHQEILRSKPRFLAQTKHHIIFDFQTYGELMCYGYTN